MEKALGVFLMRSGAHKECIFRAEDQDHDYESRPKWMYDSSYGRHRGTE